MQKAVDLVHEIDSWIDEIPPIQQPMRFGNQAFRTFHDRVLEVCRVSVRERPEASRRLNGIVAAKEFAGIPEKCRHIDMIPSGAFSHCVCVCALFEQRTRGMQEQTLPEEHREAVIELAAYLEDSFGNRVRIDYGTGHETSFIVWMCTCCEVMGVK